MGINGNKTADRLAHETSKKLLKGELTASPNLSVKAAFKKAYHIPEKSWQLQWDNEDTGRYTHQLIPLVNTRIIFPVDRNTGISYCRLLLHDTMFKQNRYRTDTSTSPMCDCGTEEESADHFLLRCKLHDVSRNVMLNSIYNISNRTRSLHISDNILLSPNYPDHLTKRDNKYIKEYLFSFISSIDKLI